MSNLRSEASPLHIRETSWQQIPSIAHRPYPWSAIINWLRYATETEEQESWSQVRLSEAQEAALLHCEALGSTPTMNREA